MRSKESVHISVTDSGALSGEANMKVDRNALENLSEPPRPELRLRLFQWSEPTVTYGYLLDPVKVREWAKDFKMAPLVKRPTGGGAVFHSIRELSFSLLWPRRSGLFPDAPRDAYESVHSMVRAALFPRLGSKPDLHLKPSGSCEQRPSVAMSVNRFSACFQEPVCNDVMLDGKKIVGGALRVTKKAVLYQGSIQVEGIPAGEIKELLVFQIKKMA